MKTNLLVNLKWARCWKDPYQSVIPELLCFDKIITYHTIVVLPLNDCNLPHLWPECDERLTIFLLSNTKLIVAKKNLCNGH